MGIARIGEMLNDCPAPCWEDARGIPKGRVLGTRWMYSCTDIDRMLAGPLGGCGMSGLPCARVLEESVNIRYDSPGCSSPSLPRGTRDTYSKDITMFLLHPCEEAGSIFSKLQGIAQPGDAAQVQGRLARSPAGTTVLITT